MSVDDRTPVLVGVGTAHRPVDGSAGVEALELMVEAARAAGADAGAPSLVARAGMVAVPEGNWGYLDAARLVADRVGASRARSVRVDVGVPQCTPVAAALDRIRRGALDVALVVGGEAMASRLRIERAGGTPPLTAQDGVEPDERWSPQGELMADAEVQAGIWAPVEQYAVMENALRAAVGRTVAEHQDHVARLWARFNQVATTNPDADFPQPRDAASLRAAGPGNRPLAFPYAKWHSTQWAVDQAGALLLCSAAAARTAGVPADRWLHCHAAAESSFSVSLTKRAEMHRWPALEVIGRGVADAIGRPLSEVEVVECYSCFPVAVEVQQQALGLDPEGTPTVTGGMAFAGGPFNNFTYQATAAVAARLRAEPTALGMVTTVSGLLTKPGVTVWSATPPSGEALVADFAEEASRATARRESTNSASGPGRVVSHTVTYADGEPERAFVVADLDDGRRWIGTTHDAELLSRGVTEGLEGVAVSVLGQECRPA